MATHSSSAPAADGTQAPAPQPPAPAESQMLTACSLVQERCCMIKTFAPQSTGMAV